MPTRIVHLDPLAWNWATWRPRQRLEPAPEKKKKKSQPTDPARQLAGLSVTRSGGWGWHGLRWPERLTPADAHFWLLALSQSHSGKTPKEVAQLLVKEKPDGNLTDEQVLALLDRIDSEVPAEFLLQALFDLLGPGRFLRLLLHGPGGFKAVAPGYTTNSWYTAILRHFFKEVLPRLTDEDMEQGRERARERLKQHPWPADPNLQADIAWYVGALLGLHAEMLAVVESWADGLGKTEQFGNKDAVRLIFGLGSGELVEKHFRRLGFVLDTIEDVTAWLAHTEWRALDMVQDAIRRAANWLVDPMVALLAAVEAPEAAPIMLALKNDNRGTKVINRWLEKHPEVVVPGLFQPACGKGAEAKAALDYLMNLRRAGREELIQKALLEATPEVAAKIRQLVLESNEKVYQPLTDADTPEWLKKVLDEASLLTRLRWPGWLAQTDLPPILVGDRQLNETQVQLLVQGLQEGNLLNPPELVKAVRGNADRQSLEMFALKLFEVWLREGAVPKERWAMQALGHFGDDLAVNRLATQIRVWSRDGQRQKALHGLESLLAIGNDAAMTQLHGLSHKAGHQSVEAKAKQYLGEIAQKLNISMDELEDRVIPTLDLDSRGVRVFDYGPRQFEVRIGPDLKPLVKDETGKPKKDLPKPGQKDDPAKSAAASEAWKGFKKLLADTIKIQSARLERAMINGREWKVQEFEKLLARHPLMGHLTRRLVWVGRNSKGERVATFRVTEEGEYVDANDDAIRLTDVATVRLPHPLHLSAEERARWSEVFADYELISPFAQLGRTIHELLPEEREATAITRFDRLKIPGISVRSKLQAHGWEPSGYGYYSYTSSSKKFPICCIVAEIEYSPGVMQWGGPDSLEDQTLTKTCFYPLDAAGNRSDKKAMILKDVDPVAVSETLTMLTLLAGSAIG